MKLFILLFATAIIASCQGTRFCNMTKSFLKAGIDTTKPYKLKGAYCIAGVRDTAIGNAALVSSKIFDRINGNRMYEGVIWFYGTDTSSIILKEDVFQKLIKPGIYVIEAWNVGYIGSKTREFEVKPNTKVEINFYLGTVVEH